ncbi:MAG: phosphopentomutase [Oscillospiraceae bacterium]|nr:phosphopentomutase [Oscillospiraceae bacterium]
MAKRAFVIVLDSFGIGYEPDADLFGDVGANTLRSVASSSKYNTPEMAAMGLFNIDGVDCRPGVSAPTASFARLQERSMGKDTTIGHWELAGIVSPRALPTYPNGFPQPLIEQFEKLVGRKVVCNTPYSGTDVIRDYGEHHMKTGDLIVYTSADSVFQVAANEAIIPIPELYDICQKARDMLTASGEHAVGRVIARPFVGTNKDNFQRTTNRHDYSLHPPKKTMLDYIQDAGMDTIGVGKIYDIFDGIGVSEKIRTTGNDNGMEVTLGLAQRDFEGLCFVNLVDFDMVYGHRRNIDGYAQALTDFDVQLRALLPKLRADDLLILTADHGCDPGYTKTTDHTREYIPMIAWGQGIKPGVNLGTRLGFCDIAATVCDFLGVKADIEGSSFYGEIKK